MGYKEVLLDRAYKSDIVIRTSGRMNVAIPEIPVANAPNEDDEKQNLPAIAPVDPADHEEAVVGKMIYQTPNGPQDDLTAEGNAADIVELGPGNGNDGEKAAPAQEVEEVENFTEFRAHKVIPWCRSDVFQAMLNHNYQEANESVVTFNDIRSKTFGVFLEFLYTDHAKIDDDIVMELLSFSNKMRETRLISWCEYLMSKVIERAVEQSIEKADLDIIGLLLTAQRHNAKQLEEFLFHFISTNYVPMSKKKEFKFLKGANLKRIEKDRWPPKYYEDQVKEYQEALKKWTEKYGDSVGSGFFGRKKSDKKLDAQPLVSAQGVLQGQQGQATDESGCLIM